MHILAILRFDYTAINEVKLLVYLKNRHNLKATVILIKPNNIIEKTLDDNSIKYEVHDVDKIKHKLINKLFFIFKLTDLYTRIIEKRIGIDIILKHKPDIIFTPVSSQVISRSIIHFSKILKIPSISIQRTAASHNFLYYEWQNTYNKRKKNHFIKKILIIYKKIFYILLGLDFKEQKCLGDGDETKFLVFGNAYAEHFSMSRINSEKMISVGHLEHQQLFEETQIVAKRAINQNINTQKKILVNISGKFIIDKICPIENSEKFSKLQNKILKSIIDNTDDTFKIILKAHPRENINYLIESVRQHPRVSIDNNNFTELLLHECDYLITDFSTLIFSAIALDKPYLTHNLLRVFSWDFPETINAGPHIRYEYELDNIIHDFLYNESNRLHYKNAREIARKRWLMFDGLIYERIAKIIKDLIYNNPLKYKV